MHDFESSRNELIEILKKNGCQNELVLLAIQKVPREKFILHSTLEYAYLNRPLPIDCDQTISQPYIVAKMTEYLLSKGKLNRILEIGTGSGYQAAILSYLSKEVYSIERFEKLYESAKKSLKEYSNVHTFYGDGYDGLKEYAPFDGIIITAAVNDFPEKLYSQMDDNCIVIYPWQSKNDQQLVLLEKNGDVLSKTFLEYVKFVPMLPKIVPD